MHDFIAEAQRPQRLQPGFEVERVTRSDRSVAQHTEIRIP